MKSKLRKRISTDAMLQYAAAQSHNVRAVVLSLEDLLNLECLLTSATLIRPELNWLPYPWTTQ